MRVIALAAAAVAAASGLVTDHQTTGSCLCGGVQYRLTGELRGVINCFCSQCRKTTGHHVAATRTRRQDLEMLRDGTLTWYASSENADRGFCNRCGGNLFWRSKGGDDVSVMAGTIDKPTGLATIENIFTVNMSDYHALPELTDS